MLQTRTPGRRTSSRRHGASGRAAPRRGRRRERPGEGGGAPEPRRPLRVRAAAARPSHASRGGRLRVSCYPVETSSQAVLPHDETSLPQTRRASRGSRHRVSAHGARGCVGRAAGERAGSGVDQRAFRGVAFGRSAGGAPGRPAGGSRRAGQGRRRGRRDRRGHRGRRHGLHHAGRHLRAAGSQRSRHRRAPHE